MITKTVIGFGSARRYRSMMTGLSIIARHEETLRRIAILAVLYLIPAMWILQPVIFDPDIWWHLQTGKWILEHGTLPVTDPFSAYGEGKPWVAYSWLFEISMYGLVQLCGERGILLYTLVGIWLTMLVLHRIIGTRCSNFVCVSGLLAVSVVALSKLFTPRPWLLTILFFAITLEVVLSLREGKRSRWFWLLPVAYAVWANIHIQFVYGLGLLGLACVVPLVDRYVPLFKDSPPVMGWGSPQWKKLIVLTALCALATLVTPYHVRLYSIVVELSAQTGMWEYATEMQAPTFRTAADWAMLGMFSFALVWFGWRRSRSSFGVLLMCIAAASAFRGQRDIWFLVLASLAVLVSQQMRESCERSSIVPHGGFVPVTLVVAAGVMCILGYRGFSEAKIHENTAKIYPIEAAAFVEQQGYTGPLYNHFDWGGYLIWRLPHLKVSMDGRANIHGDDRIKRSIATWTGGSHWSGDLELDGAGVVIAQKDMALSSLLRLDPRFQKTYQDETAVVFMRAPGKASQPDLPASGSPLPPLTTTTIASAQ
ncbi:MAG TPA: hypothetical protein VLA67_10650 [Nitrospiraceae bacterium]|nr:hypothetical protein [Nitrospiraceae bacterium]